MFNLNSFIKDDNTIYEEAKNKVHIIDKLVSDIEHKRKIIESIPNTIDKNTYKLIDYIFSQIMDSSDEYRKTLQRQIVKSYPNLSTYISLTESLYYWKERRNEILYKFMDLYALGTNANCQHQVINLGNEIHCIFCNASTGMLLQEDIDFIISCAQIKGCFIEDARAKDLALITVLKEDLGFSETARRVLVESQGYSKLKNKDDRDIETLKTKIRKAHLLDERLSNSKYLSDEKVQELLDEIRKSAEKAQKINSRFKNLFLEECLTAKYEVLILGGYSIPSLVESIDNEENFIALVKAYYNLSNSAYRLNSTYFTNESDALTYDCLTANELVNEKLLRMKIRR